MPFACSMTARRPNASCRPWYSLKRCSVMSIAPHLQLLAQAGIDRVKIAEAVRTLVAAGSRSA